jgi:hypothetical protein
MKPSITVKTGSATTGAMIDQLWAAREEKRRLEAQVKEVEVVAKDIEDQILGRMEAEGMDKATGKKGSVSITTSVVADVQDWDVLYPYIAKNKFWHLLHKRVSDPGFRELWDAGKKTPGVLPFTRKKINLRTVA